jgi:uncharacterized protein YdaU (DUF1376 family)
MKKTYFPHDSNARNDIKLIRVRKKYSYEGFGIYFALLELLFSENNKLCVDDFETLAFGLQCEPSILKDIVLNFDLFVVEGECFYSKRLNNTLYDIAQKSLKASENAKKRWTNANAMPSHKEQECRTNASKVKESKLKESKLKKSNIEKRLSEFKNSVYSQDSFNKDDLDNFFSYWSELNKSSTNPKMRWELEKTWSLRGRLVRWTRSKFNNIDKKTNFPDFFDEWTYKKLDSERKKQYESHLKSLNFHYVYNPNAGGKWIKKN